MTAVLQQKSPDFTYDLIPSDHLCNLTKKSNKSHKYQDPQPKKHHNVPSKNSNTNLEPRRKYSDPVNLESFNNLSHNYQQQQYKKNSDKNYKSKTPQRPKGNSKTKDSTLKSEAKQPNESRDLHYDKNLQGAHNNNLQAQNHTSKTKGHKKKNSQQHFSRTHQTQTNINLYESSSRQMEKGPLRKTSINDTTSQNYTHINNSSVRPLSPVCKYNMTVEDSYQYQGGCQSYHNNNNNHNKKSNRRGSYFNRKNSFDYYGKTNHFNSGQGAYNCQTYSNMNSSEDDASNSSEEAFSDDVVLNSELEGIKLVCHGEILHSEHILNYKSYKFAASQKNSAPDTTKIPLPSFY